METQWKNQHLAWRAGFGPSPNALEKLRSQSADKHLKALLKDSSGIPQYIDIVSNRAGDMLKKNMSEEEKRQLRKQSREDIRSLNLRWLDEMIHSPAQLREKMAFFWHGHFACRNLNIYYQQLLLHTLRNHALGSFADLLHAVSRSAAMLNFLNNNQNRKGHPNENFAREVMELFTMGRGNYSENDIKEAARAFTGWGANAAGEFVFRDKQHDSGTKTFLGTTGNLDGNDIINILLEQPATAKFITGKFIRFFVSETVPENIISRYADHFRQSGYNITSLIESVFGSDWFYAPQYRGNRIKSPIELWVGIRRQLPFTLPDPDIQLQVEKLLGQVLFYPPNVAGWPMGKNWIDGSSLLFRMRLPQLITGSETLQLKPKQDDDVQMGRPQPATSRNFRAVIDWQQFNRPFLQLKEKDRKSILERFLLQSNTIPNLGSQTDNSQPELAIGTLSLSLMSTPEYQLN